MSYDKCAEAETIIGGEISGGSQTEGEEKIEGGSAGGRDKAKVRCDTMKPLLNVGSEIRFHSLFASDFTSELDDFFDLFVFVSS